MKYFCFKCMCNVVEFIFKDFVVKVLLIKIWLLCKWEIVCKELEK